MKFINKKKIYVIAFMGVDGAGKSTIIDRLIKKFSKKNEKIKYLHLRPYLFLTDTRTVIKNPHNKKKINSKIYSFFNILWWLILYRIFFLINYKKHNKLILFDRYAHDLLIDPVRYQFNLKKKLTKYILNFFPEPDVWIVLTASIKKIEKRKNELSSYELKKQMKMYIDFSKTKKNSFILNTNKSILENLKFLEKKNKIN